MFSAIVTKESVRRYSFFPNFPALSLAFGLGVGFLFLQEELPQNLSALLAVSGIFLLLSFRFSLSVLSLAFLLGFFYAWYAADSYFNTRLKPEYSGKDITVSGIVDGIPAHNFRRMSFNLKVDKAKLEDKKLALKKIRLSWYGRYKDLRPGQRLQLTARLKTPRALKNPAGFDYARWLMQNRFDATGYVRAQNPVIDRGKSLALIDQIHRFRFYLKQKILNKLDNQDIGALFLALIIGDRSNISQKQWQVLQATGTSHLLAISGLHLSLVAVGGFYIFSFILSLINLSSVRLNILRLASLFAFVISLFYALIAGLTLPTQRALIMLGIGFIYVVLKHKTSPFIVLNWALFICLLYDPFAVLAAGFWLSFVAVFWILFLVKFHYSASKFVLLFKIQLILAIGLLPLVTGFNLPVSTVAIPANLLVLPVVSMLVLPLILLAAGFVLINDFISLNLFALAQFIFAYVYEFMQFMADFNWHKYSLPINSFAEVVFCFFLTLLLLMPRGLPGKFVATSLLGLWLISSNSSLKQFEARITVLDVGQGQAVLLETRNHVLLYDAGPKYGSGSSAFARVIAPVLKHKNINKIDRLILSHFDADHAGGAEQMLTEITVNDVMAPALLADYAVDNICSSGQNWIWDGVEFVILHPMINDKFSGNNSSCVLRINTGAKSLLLTGDIELKAERIIVNRRFNIKSDILLLAHHGSNTSSSVEFLNEVAPTYAIVSSAYKNQHKFPHERVVKRLKAGGINLYNTADDGAIEVLLNPARIDIQTLRAKNKRLWD